MTKMICFAVFISTFLFGICNSLDSKIYFENELSVEQSNLKEQPISHGITKLAFNLDHAFSSKDKSGNVLFSPYSIASALALLLLGAKGYTALELSQFLGLNYKGRMDLDYRLKSMHEQFGYLSSNLAVKSTDGYEIDSATGIFPQRDYPVKQEYINTAEKVYHSDVCSLDYASRNFDAMAIINKWIANKTHDRITHLLGEPPIPETTIIVASALYFNGNWKYPFPVQGTRKAPFFVRKNYARKSEEMVDIELMVNSADIPYFNDEIRHCEMIGIPYKGDEVHMYIILPEDNIETLMKNLTENDLHSMIKSTEITTTIYAIPKMTLDNNVDLTPILRNLGLATTFNPAQADFRNIAEGVFVDKVLHKVEVEVNESGTKASAATLASVTRSGTTPVVRVDKPFLFFIHHRTTDTILFWGKINKPTPNFPHVMKQSRRF